MRTRSTVIAALVTVVGALSAVVAPAQADTKSIRDRTGDAPSRFDLSRVTVSNEPAGLTVRARVRDLTGDGAQIFVANVRSGGDHPSYYVSSVRRANGSVVTSLLGEDGSENVTCGVSSRWRVARNRIQVRIPRACLAEDRAVSVSVAIGAGTGKEGDPADWTRTFRVGFG